MTEHLAELPKHARGWGPILDRVIAGEFSSVQGLHEALLAQGLISDNAAVVYEPERLPWVAAAIGPVLGALLGPAIAVGVGGVPEVPTGEWVASEGNHHTDDEGNARAPDGPDHGPAGPEHPGIDPHTDHRDGAGEESKVTLDQRSPDMADDPYKKAREEAQKKHEEEQKKHDSKLHDHSDKAVMSTSSSTADGYTSDAEYHYHKHLQLFRVFNAIEWAMTSTAFMVQSGWREHQDRLRAALGVSEPSDRALYVFGQERHPEAPSPASWMPTPYLCVETAKLVDEIDLFGLACPPNKESELRVYPQNLRRMFLSYLEIGSYVARNAGSVLSRYKECYHGMPVTAAVLAYGDHEETVRFSPSATILPIGARFENGTTVACANFRLPDGWKDVGPTAKWARFLRSVLGSGSIETHLRIWFERQGLRLVPGRVVPSGCRNR